MIEDKYIGLALAMSSSLAIGTSFIITKKGLMDASSRQGFEGDGFQYLKNPIWWAGMVTMAVGEVANFAAYTFAPAVLVTPLGALSVIIGAVLAALILKEELGVLGRMGCSVCLMGAVIIVLHAPSDKDLNTVDEFLGYALHPAFFSYVLFVGIFALIMIYKVAPKYGKTNPMVYISICSTVGSVSVMAIKGFGVALKLTFAGKNQFTHASTYLFIIVVVVCIMTQMNYFNKALDQFDTSIVNPLYYVSFTTATLCASFLLFRGFNTSSIVDIISLIIGFLIIFSGVYLLNIARKDPDGASLIPSKEIGSIPLDNMTANVQIRRSISSHSRSFSLTSRDLDRHSRSFSSSRDIFHSRTSNDIRDEEEGLGLTSRSNSYDINSHSNLITNSDEDDDGENESMIINRR